MKRTIPLFIAAFCFLITVFSAGTQAQMVSVPGPGELLSLCYHNVEDSDPEQSYVGVTTSKLIEQLSWLQHEGYHPVSVDALLAARAGGKPLPSKAVLLTFDDGYASFYTRVYPVLKAFKFPAVIAVEDEWMTGKPGDQVPYGKTMMPRSAFLTWPQVRDMQRSGLIEVASHSHALHKGILTNAQGNLEPAAVTPLFDPETQTYEEAPDYLKRLQEDAADSAKTILQQTGKKPRVMVWPYGAYNGYGMAVNDAQGMAVSLSLDDGFAKVASLNVPRMLVTNDPDISSFAVQVLDAGQTGAMRTVQVDLDYVYDPDPKQMAANVSQLVSRIHDMKITTVFLQAFADPKGTGLAREVYFPNRLLPMRADLFNHVAWQLRTRAHVKVYAWLPVLSFDFGESVTPVMAWDPKSNEIKPAANAYRRVSPFDPAGRQKITELYEDLARHGPVDGILFHDDAMLSDFEDASPPALAAYQRAGFGDSVAAIRANQEQMGRWTNFKTQALIDFTHELTAHVKKYRAPLVTVRNIYAPLLMNPASEEWFAQNYTRFLDAYDYVAIEAMPRMENVSENDAEEWLHRLVDVVAASPKGLKHTVFELQTVDWREQAGGNNRAVPAEELSAQMRLLARRGALNIGYYPDDFVTDTPNAKLIHQDFSIQSYPYTP